MTGSRTMLITRSDEGYFGLKQCLSGVFGDAVSLLFEAIDEHWVTEGGHPVAT